MPMYAHRYCIVLLHRGLSSRPACFSPFARGICSYCCPISGIELISAKPLYILLYILPSLSVVRTTYSVIVKDGDVKLAFANIEKSLRLQYKDHILPRKHTQWIFVNCGGWMGAMYLLHASLFEYILLFGTAVDTSGHSGMCNHINKS